MRERQREIIHTLGIKPEVDPLQEIERRTQFLADHLGHTGLRGFILGISGGQDSLLAGILAQRAVEHLRSNGHGATFYAALLPYSAQIDRDDAELAIKTINPDKVRDLDIQPSVDAFATSFHDSEGSPLLDFDKGNVKARMRMIAQYAFASTHDLLVIGADHAAEAATGFFTKHGDGGADILPLAGLTKRQGRAMLRVLHVPDVFITKQPTADLLDTHPGQADENELGIRYDVLDDYLEGKEVSTKAAVAIETRYDATAHKRALPVSYAIKKLVH